MWPTRTPLVPEEPHGEPFLPSNRKRNTRYATICLLLQGSRFIDIIKGYRTKIEKELEDICNDVLKLLDDPLIPNSKNPEARVFFMKMKGDYFRYLGEFTTGDKRKNVIQLAQEAYKVAS